MELVYKQEHVKHKSLLSVDVSPTFAAARHLLNRDAVMQVVHMVEHLMETVVYVLLEGMALVVSKVSTGYKVSDEKCFAKCHKSI